MESYKANFEGLHPFLCTEMQNFPPTETDLHDFRVIMRFFEYLSRENPEFLMDETRFAYGLGNLANDLAVRYPSAFYKASNDILLEDAKWRLTVGEV